MHKRMALMTPLALVTLLVAAGCTSVQPKNSAMRQITAPHDHPPTAAAAAPSGAARAVAGPFSEMSEQEAMAEVAPMLGELATADPALHAEVLQQLAGTKPSLWSLTVQRAQHTLAYKQQLAAKSTDAGTKRIAKTPTASPPPPTPASAPTTIEPSQVVQASATMDTGSATPPTVDRNSQQAPSVIENQHFAVGDNQNFSLSDRAPATASPLPQPNTAAIANPHMAPQANALFPSAQFPGSQQQSPPATGALASAPADWRAHLDAAITQLDADSSSAPQSADEARERLRLQLMQLVAGKTDQAVAAAPGLSAGEQGYWSNQLYALSTLLDEEKSTDHRARIDAAARHQAEASAKLRALGSLQIRNFVTCREVYGFGAYEPMSDARYAPGDQVVLYAEIDNYRSDATSEGYHTTFSSTYRLVRENGEEVASGDFPEVDDLCLTMRRDFHIQYGVTLPESLSAGDYRLELSITDRLGDKIGRDELIIAVTGR